MARSARAVCLYGSYWLQNLTRVSGRAYKGNVEKTSEKNTDLSRGISKERPERIVHGISEDTCERSTEGSLGAVSEEFSKWISGENVQTLGGIAKELLRQIGRFLKNISDFLNELMKKPVEDFPKKILRNFMEKIAEENLEFLEKYREQFQGCLVKAYQRNVVGIS